MKRLVIVGGGLAGVLTAKMVLNKCKDWSVTLIEDPEFKGKGGIQGESLTPTMVSLIQETLGYEITSEWVEFSQATIKVGGRLKGWGSRDIYMSNDMYRSSHVPLYEWTKGSGPLLGGLDALESLYTSCTPAVQLMRSLYNPNIDLNNPGSRIEHDWSLHLDASLLSDFILRNLHSNIDRFSYIPQKLVKINNNNTYIDSLLLSDNIEIEGDLYIDATGIARVLTKKVGRSFTYLSDLFPNNSVVYGYVHVDTCKNYTDMVTATNGWMWEIPLTTKTSVGYIYSNKFITKEEAIKELMKEYPEVPYKDIKAISFDPFILDKPWVDNLISIGLGQSFIDPLQSSILLQTRTHLTSLIEALKSPNPLGYVQIDKFNRMCTDHRDAFLAFIELHYRGCIRRDTKYWRYVTSIPHISKGASDFINYGNTYINNRPLDWEKWHILAAGLELIDLSRTYEGSR